ncbi:MULTISPECIES: bifunctional metallophosphatase/5'-nucleotidase [unclassified Mesobacillus]|uniref:bifunctional metallophosphatase/5'-nucleotidase n=1 Tax=unclassified Mesobacillus TaxID=2675270 RepID=UPI00203E088A|nr:MULTISPECIES: bifunctional metallophosphatase/5'-nucleotidase [unclassified Mesobacillus]MCM3125804.1 bifunctional metallophosphatase/5'-nucleotidase [Mesobacillus sp. MER 33]MCM3235825.1 bifunctional metallophosphatase/5'-nucleotidase [Mesobacillus sp. MER 48]
MKTSIYRKVAASIITVAFLTTGYTAYANLTELKENRHANPLEGEEHIQQSGWDESADKSVTLMQLGDLHGHLIPRKNLNTENFEGTVGGLARIATVIKEIRKESSQNLLFNIGDTLHGGAEALYTEGKAMTDILDKWRIDGYASGNWDFLYGTERYLDLFENGRWGAVAANLYYEGEPYADKAGERVLPPYRVIKRAGLSVGIVGFTSERGPTVGTSTTKGFRFTGEGEELPEMIHELREKEKVDLIIMISELGLAKNLQLANRYPGVDVLLSADMHEETPRLIETKSGTLVSEVSHDGIAVGQLDLQVGEEGITGWRYELHKIDESIKEDEGTSKLVEKERAMFVKGKGFHSHENPINKTILYKPIDTVIGEAKKPLYRGNFSDHEMPGVVEGSSHNFLADVFRKEAGADIGTIRGFRYGTHVATGDIRLEDIYHFIPVAPFIAKGTITGSQLHDQIERSLNGSLNPDPFKWTGGWVQAYSGVRYELDPYAPAFGKASNIEIFDQKKRIWQPLDKDKQYTVAGYWYPGRPDDIGTGLKINDNAQTVNGPEGNPLDATEVVARYLSKNQADPELGRVKLLHKLPEPAFGNREIQPLNGVPERVGTIQN